MFWNSMVDVMIDLAKFQKKLSTNVLIGPPMLHLNPRANIHKLLGSNWEVFFEILKNFRDRRVRRRAHNIVLQACWALHMGMTQGSATCTKNWEVFIGINLEEIDSSIQTPFLEWLLKINFYTNHNILASLQVDVPIINSERLTNFRCDGVNGFSIPVFKWESKQSHPYKCRFSELLQRLEIKLQGIRLRILLSRDHGSLVRGGQRACQVGPGTGPL